MPSEFAAVVERTAHPQDQQGEPATVLLVLTRAFHSTTLGRA